VAVLASDFLWPFASKLVEGRTLVVLSLNHGITSHDLLSVLAVSSRHSERSESFSPTEHNAAPLYGLHRPVGPAAPTEHNVAGRAYGCICW
jgi:hypothetical protein